MKRVEIAPGIVVGSQPSPDEVKTLKQEGFKSIINNRFDGENNEAYMSAADAAAKAKAEGLAYAHLPVTGATLTEPNYAEEFAKLIENLPKPIFAHCRSGTRTTSLWALAQAGKMSTDEIIAKAAQAGYDLEKLRPAIEQRAAREKK